MKVWCLLLMFVYEVNCITYDTNTYFVNGAVLTSGHIIYWNYTTESITFKLVMRTTGWVGFGLVHILNN